MLSFLENYNKLNASNLDLLQEMYSEDIVFEDPLHTLHGRAALHSYFEKLYHHVESLHFSFSDLVQQGNEGYVQWEMEIIHPKLNRGARSLVPGMSYLRLDAEKKVWFHRDQYDLGSLFYENIPLLNGVIRAVKRRILQ